PDWGRYFVRVVDLDGGHSTGKAVYIDWPGWAGRARNDGDGGAAMLSFTADKQEYQVGESVSLTIPSAKNGRALVTIESGSSVLDAKWLETVDGQTSYSFPVTKAMAPNVYIHVSLLQPHGQEGNDRPIRMYGVVPIKVVDPFSIIKPVISMPDVLRPEEDVTIAVSEASGHPMTYTIAIVDEGLLGLTRFKTPDPWSAFYAKEALNVKTWDIYDMVMGAYGGKLDKLLAVGGDEVNRPKGGKKAQRFKPMVRYLGPFYLKSGKQDHRVHIPRYIGAVRTMVIAGDNGAYGAAEKSTPVRKPVMVLATLPRVIAPGEHVGMPVTVFAMEKNVKKVQVNIKTEGQLKLMGPASQSVSFSEVGDQTIHFDLKVLEATGTGKVTVTATSGSEKATYEVEMEVRPPNLPSTEVISQMIPAGQSWSPDFDAFGLAGTNRATIEVSSLPPLDLEKRIRYLIQYPHGCVEQTTSGAFPQLYLDALMELTPAAKQTIRQNINAAIQRLLNFQQPGGGMSYWPGNSDYSEWGTTYAGHFMIEAAAKGYSVPTSFLTRWVKFQTNAALQWKYDIHHSDLQQAYRLYTLALAKSPAMGAMNRLRESSNLSTAAKWRLAAAYALCGQIETAKKLTMNLPKDSSPYQELSYTYGSRERDLAMVLETLLLLKQDQEAFKLLQLLSKELSTNRWMSTQTLAYSLLAVGKYSQNVTSSTLDFSTTVNNGKVILVKQTKPVHQQTFNPKMKDNKVIVKNTSNGALYARICMQGIPPAGEETDGASDLTLFVNYKTLDGYAIDVSRLEQGTDFMAEVTITHTGVRGIDYDQMALSQLFPCGWEIINTRLDDNETLGRGIDQPTYQDIRDDRVYTYFNVGRSNKKTFRVLLNASYLGHYYLPAVQASAMYDETIYARKKGQWVDIVRSPEQ
ncbi:MAG: hypothetical protein KDD36_14250, partial [Flavobacteriales bacterium]|nr:hypothetical protein [Flavobacteriales bacterium]